MTTGLSDVPGGACQVWGTPCLPAPGTPREEQVKTTPSGALEDLFVGEGSRGLRAGSQPRIHNPEGTWAAVLGQTPWQPGHWTASCHPLDPSHDVSCTQWCAIQGLCCVWLDAVWWPSLPVGPGPDPASSAPAAAWPGQPFAPSRAVCCQSGQRLGFGRGQSAQILPHSGPPSVLCRCGCTERPWTGTCVTVARAWEEEEAVAASLKLSSNCLGGHSCPSWEGPIFSRAAVELNPAPLQQHAANGSLCQLPWLLWSVPRSLKIHPLPPLWEEEGPRTSGRHKVSKRRQKFISIVCPATEVAL